MEYIYLKGFINCSMVTPFSILFSFLPDPGFGKYPAIVGFGQSRSKKWIKNAIHSFRDVQVKKKWLEIEIEKWKWNESDWKLRSWSESEMKKLQDQDVKFLENSREFLTFQNLFLTYFVLGSAPSSNVWFFYETQCQISLFFLWKSVKFFSLSLFSRNECEIRMTGNRDREVK